MYHNTGFPMYMGSSHITKIPFSSSLICIWVGGGKSTGTKQEKREFEAIPLPRVRGESVLKRKVFLHLEPIKK